MDVLYLTSDDDEPIGLLQDRVGSAIRVRAVDRESVDEALDAAARAEVIVGGVIPPQLMAAAPELRYVVIPWSGVPRRDRETLAAYPQVTVVNSHFNARAAAEHTWALLMAAAKRLLPVDRSLRRGDWSPRYSDFPSWQLAGATLLIVGYGAIGRVLTPIARALQMRVMGITRRPRPLPELDDAGTAADLTRLLPAADAVLVTLPDTDEATGLIGAAEFAAMKDGVLFVNVGRGPAVDETAFYEALRDGKIGAAGIDTWWRYPTSVAARTKTPPSQHPVEEFDNLIMSCHRATHVPDRERERMEDIAVLLRAIASGRPINVVDREVWY